MHFQSFLVPLILARAGQRRLAGQGQFDAVGDEYFIHRGDGVEGLGEADERRALVDGLPDFHRRAAGVEAGLHMGFELGQGAEGRQHRDRDELPHSIIEAAGAAHIPEDIALQDLQERAVGPLVPGGVAVEQLLHVLFGSFFAVHTVPSLLLLQRLCAHCLSAASEGLPLSRPPATIFAPGQLEASSAAVCPNPLPPEVANRTMVFPAKS